MEDTFDPSLILDGSNGGGASAALPAAATDPNHGWQKVIYPKRQRKQQTAPDPDRHRANGLAQPADRPNVFASVEQVAQERHRALKSAAAVAAAAEAAGSTRSRLAIVESDDEDDDSGEEAGKVKENGEEAALKKVKQKKPKKPKVTVAEAAAKIDAADLAAFLVDISTSYESQQDIQLMRFADYFARAFASVSTSQFPWAKIFKESPVSKLVDIPLNHISEPVYKNSVDWLAQKSPESLGNFILWCMDGIIADLTAQQPPSKGSKRPVQQTSSKAQVAIFVVLAMCLRRKPEILISLLPKIRESSNYQGQEKLPIIVWIFAQASLGERVIGMYIWAHYLFPLVCGKSSGNPQSRDLILQLAERILSGPKARPTLLNSAVRKGERLVPPMAFDLLMRMTFPPPAARIKATERFEAVYPTLKEIALSGLPGTKTTKQASQQLLPAVIQAIKENSTELTKEAVTVFIWCLIQNVECYKQWEKLHLENIDGSVAVLKKLSEDWKEYSGKVSPDVLKATLKHLMAKNEEALSGDLHGDKHGSIKDAEKYCRAILAKLNRGSACFKTSISLLLVIIMACLAAFLAVDPSEWGKLQAEWKKLEAIIMAYLASISM